MRRKFSDDVENRVCIFAQFSGVPITQHGHVSGERTSIFDANSFLRPELSGPKKLVALNVIVWNSGTETIEETDIRRPITMKIAGSSKIVEARVGASYSRRPDSFNGHQVDQTTYELRWKDFDPKDYFQVHFLIGTDLDEEQLPQLAKINVLLKDNLEITLADFDGLAEWHSKCKLLGQFIVGFLVLGILTSLIPKEANSAWRLWLHLLAILISLSVAVFVVPLAVSHYFDVPSWTSPLFFTERPTTLQ